MATGLGASFIRSGGGRRDTMRGKVVSPSCAKVPGRTDTPISVDRVEEGGDMSNCVDRLRCAGVQRLGQEANGYVPSAIEPIG